MSLTVDTKAFRAAVEAVAPIASASRVVTLLQHVHIHTNDEYLTVSAMNHEAHVVRTIPATALEDLDLMLPGGLLSAFVKGAQKDRINVEPDDKMGARLVCGPSKVRLPGLDPQDFPCPPSWDGAATIYEGDAAPMADLLSRAVPCVYPDPRHLKYALLCVCLQSDSGRVSAVATDTTVLAARKAEFRCADGEWMIPADMAARLVSSGNMVLARLSDGRYGARGEGWADVYTAIDHGSKFPAWERVVPASPPLRIAALRGEFSSAVRRVLAYADRGETSVIVTPDPDGVVVSIPDCGDGRSAREAVDASISEGPPFRVNAQKLLKAMDALDGEGLKMAYESSHKPVLLTGDGDSIAVALPQALA